jgi:hypothetical protein
MTLLLLLLVLLTAGCGLPSPFYLTPPATPTPLATPTGTPYFQVISTTANIEPEFRGFELYYKCYKTTGDPIESDFGTSSFESDLRRAGFLPVCSETDVFASGRSAPLIYIDPTPPTDRGEAFTITVDFNSPANAKYEYTGPKTGTFFSVGVRRSVSDGVGKFKTFDPTQFQSTDVDISRIFADAQLAGEFYIAMYAMSYGKQDLATTIWSSPVYLGYIHILL